MSDNGEPIQGARLSGRGRLDPGHDAGDVVEVEVAAGAERVEDLLQPSRAASKPMHSPGLHQSSRHGAQSGLTPSPFSGKDQFLRSKRS